MFSSDSQTTLINPKGPMELISSKPGISNTVLYLDERPYISISTLDNAGARTQITNVRENKRLATIQRHTFSSDKITFHQRDGPETKVKIKEWLLQINDIWTVSTPIGDYIWRKDPALRIALYSASDALWQNPIAWVRRETPNENVAFIIQQNAQTMIAEIIAAFYILEQKLRIEEKEAALIEQQVSHGMSTGIISRALASFETNGIVTNGGPGR